ncbi:MAG: hypothetical protein ACLFNX_04555 [Spirochaetaceae bacterium]
MRSPFRSTKHVSVRRIRSLPALAVLFGLFLLVFAPVGAYAQSCDPPDGLSDAWEFRAHDLEALVSDPGEPQLVEKNIRTLKNSAEGELDARLHLHALFPEDVEDFEAAIRDIERQSEFLPNLKASEVLCSDGRPTSYARVRQELGFRFLIFSRDYEYILHYFLESTDGRDASLNVWWQLDEPLDDQILTTDGSWYFERVVVEDREYTYMAYGTHTVFRERKRGLKAAMDRFGERNAAAAMKALQEEAAERGD